MAGQTVTGYREPGFGVLTPISVAEDDVNLRQLIDFFRRHRRLFIVCVVAAVVLSTVLASLLPSRYTARASFVPQGRPQISGLASLAAQFGVGIPGSDATRSPAFYVSLLSSKNLLAHVVDKRFSVSGEGTPSGTLIDILEAKGDTPEKRRESAVKKLRGRLAVSVDPKSSIVAIEVRTKNAKLSRDVAQALLGQIDSFNLATRQSQASSERRFTEGRLAEARAELRGAEDELQAFLQSNRDFRGSPHLTFLYDRLTRNVSLKQQLYTTLAQAFEQARIEEVRDTPVVTVVEEPMLPARADPPPRGRALAASLLLMLAVGTVVARRRDARVR